MLRERGPLDQLRRGSWIIGLRSVPVIAVRSQLPESPIRPLAFCPLFGSLLKCGQHRIDNHFDGVNGGPLH